MPRTKLKRFQKIKELPNVISFDDYKSNLKELNFFNNKKIYSLEIGCGHGDYSIELGKKYPQRNFVGIDLKAARIFNGAVKALELKLNNVAFIIGRAERLEEIFSPNSIEEIFIPFPDPHFRRKSETRRLVSPLYLNIYKGLLIESGEIHLKTDNEPLFKYAIKSVSGFGCKILHSSRHVYDSDTLKTNFGIVTTYERFYIKEGKEIMYLRFKI
jgi:tRNA (guanine-N7-)-methyltransferase